MAGLGHRLLVAVAGRSPITAGAPLFEVDFAEVAWEISVVTVDFNRPLDSAVVVPTAAPDASFVGPFPLLRSLLSSSEQQSATPLSFTPQLPPP